MLGGGEAEADCLQAEMLLTDVPINTPPYLQDSNSEFLRTGEDAFAV